MKTKFPEATRSGLDGLDALIARMRDVIELLPEEERAVVGLRCAAQIMENAAYDLAPVGRSADVADIILRSASIEHLGDALRANLATRDRKAI